MPVNLPIMLPEFLEHADGEIRVTGHRITLYHVLQEYNAGESAEAIALKLPTLKLSTIHKIIAFYLDQQPAIDAYIAEYRKTLESQEAAAPAGISRAELLRRLENMRLKAKQCR